MGDIMDGGHVSSYSDLLARHTLDVAHQRANTEERVLYDFRAAHGRWPEWVWSSVAHETGPDGLRMIVTATCGDELPAGVRAARRSGVLNTREVVE